jgi:DNA-binding PadR family transcriptional regulator
MRTLHYAILGLLAEGPAHGYLLRDAFASGGELGAVLRVEPPTLYAALKDLQASGAIEGRERRAGARPPRVEYRLTGAGREAFERWLRQPVERLREVRSAFLLKVYFLRRRDACALRELVRDQIAACARYLDALEAWAAALPSESWLALVAESRTTAARSTLAWLRTYEARLDDEQAAGRGGS